MYEIIGVALLTLATFCFFVAGMIKKVAKAEAEAVEETKRKGLIR